MDNPEEEDQLVEQMDDEEVQDEGFVEEEPEDLTVPILHEPFEPVPQASFPSSLVPSPPQSSTSIQGQPPSHHPTQPPTQPPAQPNGASGPATSAGSSVADQAPVSRLLISCSSTFFMYCMQFNSDILHALCCI